MAFDYEGLVRTACILCAFGFALLAGLPIRRSMPASSFHPVAGHRLVVESVFRPHDPPTAQVNCPQPTDCSNGISSVPQVTGQSATGY